MARTVAVISGESRDGERVVDVRGELDVGSAAALRDWLTRASDGGRRSVVVDLRGVTFLAISGLYVLCDEQQRMASSQARLTIVCTDPRVEQLFSVCRLDEVLHVVAERRSDEVPPWCEEDERRAARSAAWLQRYSAASA